MEPENDLEQEENQFEGLIQGLIDNGYGCSDDFLDPKIILGLRNIIQNHSILGEMKSAGVGNNSNLHQDQRFRGDKIKWLEEKSENQFEDIFLTKVLNFSKYLNKTCYTSINNFESHYASYQKKSFYKRHVDQFKDDSRRKYSLVLYLNKDWQTEDGGLLSMYPKNIAQKDIAPIGGRMVFFKSDEMEHEVHPSFTRDRISIAGWFKS